MARIGGDPVMVRGDVGIELKLGSRREGQGKVEMEETR
jgi:hypothetical protein